MKMDDMYAIVGWIAEDVQDVRPDWDLHKCENELSKIADLLEEKIVEFGSKQLDSMLPKK